MNQFRVKEVVRLLGGSRTLAWNSLAGFCLFGISDALAQEFEQQRSKQGHEEKSKDGKLTAVATGNDDASCERMMVLHPATATATLSSPTWNWNNERFDHVRCVTAAGMGVFLGGFVYPLAYVRLDALIVGQQWQAVLKKSVLEVATVGIFVNSISILGRGYLTGRHSLPQTFRHLRKELPTVTFNDARVWIPYNVVAFGFIPIHIRPVTTSLMEALWQSYISYRSNDYNNNNNKEADHQPKSKSPRASTNR